MGGTVRRGRAGVSAPNGGGSGVPPRPVGDRGAGTVLALALIAGVLILGGGLALLAQAQSARGRAQIAADLGALAGATALRGSGDACGVAASTVQRNGARLAACELVGGEQVRVRVVVRTGPGEAGAAARAGPASARG